MKVVWLCIGCGLIAFSLVSTALRSKPVASGCLSPSRTGVTEVVDGVGFNIDFVEPRATEIKMLAQSGVRWVRTDLKWDATEIEKGKYDFSRYDRLVEALNNAGLRIVFILDYGNPLYDNGAPPRSEASRNAFVRWSVAVARNFAGRGIVWELYNEPNHSQFWPPRVNVDEYVALGLAVGLAFETYVPREQLVGPATAGIDFPFLEACFKAGLLKYWSAVSVHPYRRDNPETVAEDYCRLRELIQQYAPSNKQIRIFAGEWGYSAAWPNVDDKKQADLLVRSWLINAANGVDLSVWYDWHDDGQNRSEAEHNFGVVSNHYFENRAQPYDPKPGYYAVKTFTSYLAGQRFEQQLKVELAEDYVLVFRSRTGTVVAAWTTMSSGHQIVLPITEGRFRSLSTTGENLGIVTASANGMNVTLTQSPQYLIKD